MYLLCRIPAQRLLRSGDRQCSHATRRRSYDARLVRPASQITRSAGRGGVLRPATLLARDPFFGECHNNDSPSISVGCVVQGLRITRLTSTSIHIDVPALSLVSRAYGPIGRPPTRSSYLHASHRSYLGEVGGKREKKAYYDKGCPLCDIFTHLLGLRSLILFFWN